MQLRYTIGLWLCFVFSSLHATLIIPPSDIGDMAHQSQAVVYGKVIGNIDNNPDLNQLQIIEVIKGDFQQGDIIPLEEYSRHFPNGHTKILGDVDFEIGKSYLLFLGQTGNGNYKLNFLALSAFETGKIQGKQVLAHNAAILDLVFTHENTFDLNGLKGVYELVPMLRHLKQIVQEFTPFNETKAGLQVYGNYLPMRPMNNHQHHNHSRTKAPCGDDVPCHCTTIFGGDMSTPAAGNLDQSTCNANTPGKFVSNTWTVCVAGADANMDGNLNDVMDTGGDPSTMTEIDDLLNAIAALDAMPGVNISYEGINTCTNTCFMGTAAADAQFCSDIIPSDNKMWIFFDDPCGELPDLDMNCAGIVGAGGALASGSCHVDETCGTTWSTLVDPFFIMNNGAGCTGRYAYTSTLIHEMLHGIGLGHIGGEAGGTTIMGTGCAAIDGTTPNETQCTALMNPAICNGNSPTDPNAIPGDAGFDGAANYGITSLDEACTDWMYNPLNTSNCAITNVAVTNVVCDAMNVLSFDVTFDYVDADEDADGMSAFDVEVGGVVVNISGSTQNSGDADAGNLTLSITETNPTSGGTVTIRNAAVYACTGEDLNVTIPACPMVNCMAITSLPNISVEDVCAGENVIVNLDACNYGQFGFEDEVSDATCTDVNATWTDYLYVPTWNIYDDDPTMNAAANLLGSNNAVFGCMNLTVPASTFPNTTCDPITYTLYARASFDRYCANIDNSGAVPTLLGFGDLLDKDFQECVVITLPFNVNPQPAVAPNITNDDGSCNFDIAYNCPSELSIAMLPTGTSPAGTVDLLVTNTQGGCSMTFSNINYNACVPVELLSFEGRYQNDKVELEWTTASELNNDHFVVERSEDGVKFEAIGKVQGAGNSISLLRYTYTDENISATQYYYRLKQVDTDGAYEYSNIIAVNTKTDKLDVKIYPSPTRALLEVAANEKIDHIRVFDLTGRAIQSNIIDGQKNIQLDVSTFQNGTYFVRVQSKQAVSLLRFVKH